MDLKALAEKNHDYVVEMRRYFHRHPELSTQEVNTSKKICEELEKMGEEIHCIIRVQREEIFDKMHRI